MPAALALSYIHTYTTKIPLLHYQRLVTHAWFLVWASIDLYYGKGPQLLEVLLGQVVFCYLFVGSMGELYFHKRLLGAGADKDVKARRFKQSVQEILVATEALVGVCAFSCCVYEIIDPRFCQYYGYFANPIINMPGLHDYTAGWCAANIAFYLLFCDAWYDGAEARTRLELVSTSSVGFADPAL